MAKVLRAGIGLSLLSVAAVLFLLYYVKDMEVVDPVTCDCRLLGTSYELVVDLYGPPSVEASTILTWEDEWHPIFGRLQRAFPLMQPGDTVNIKMMRWNYSDGRQRLIYMYYDGSGWRLFRTIEWPDYVQF